MTIAQPQTIANPLFQKLETLFKLDREITIFDTNSIKLEADKLAKTDTAAACIVKAGIAALHWDLEEAKNQTRNVLQLAPNNVSLLLNCAVNFRLLNDLKSAAEYAMRALRLANNDRAVLVETATYFFNAGRSNEAYELLNSRKEMGLSVEDLTQSSQDFLGWMMELEISEAQLHNEIDFAFEVLSKHRIRFEKVKFEKIEFHDEELVSLNVQIQFLGNFETELQLESELAERLIDLPEWDISKLNVEFSHIPRDELQAT